MLHTFWIGNLRLVLDAVLIPGMQHTSGHAKAPFVRLLDELGESVDRADTKAKHFKPPQAGPELVLRVAEGV